MGTMCWECFAENKDSVGFIAFDNTCHLIQFIKICLLNFVGQNNTSLPVSRSDVDIGLQKKLQLCASWASLLCFITIRVVLKFSIQL